MSRRILFLVGLSIVTIIITGSTILFTNQDSNTTPTRSDTNTAEEPLEDHTDDEGEEFDSAELEKMKLAAESAAKEYFSFVSDESTNERKNRLQPFFDSSSKIPGQNPPSFAKNNNISARIIESGWAPLGAGQDIYDINVSITVDLLESGVLGGFKEPRRELWVFMLRKTEDTWKPYDVLPFSDPRLDSERRSD